MDVPALFTTVLALHHIDSFQIKPSLKVAGIIDRWSLLDAYRIVVSTLFYKADKTKKRY